LTPSRLRWAARLGILFVPVTLLVATWAGAAAAHPLGNFTVNTYSGLTVGPDRVSVDFVVDMAEIPSYQAKQSMGPVAAGLLTKPSRWHSDPASATRSWPGCRCEPMTSLWRCGWPPPRSRSHRARRG
jgi:hypothetical protein